MKVKLIEDEMYPYYIIKDNFYAYGIEIDIPEELVKEYNIAQKRFEKARDKLEQLT